MLEPKSSRNYCRISTIGSLPERGLVGDDELVNREVLGRLLQGNGNAAEPVGSGQPALVKLKLHPFGFVLLDVLVPQMDGFEFLQRIRESFSVSETALFRPFEVLKTIESRSRSTVTTPRDSATRF